MTLALLFQLERQFFCPFFNTSTVDSVLGGKTLRGHEGNSFLWRFPHITICMMEINSFGSGFLPRTAQGDSENCLDFGEIPLDASQHCPAAIMGSDIFLSSLYRGF